MEQHQIIGSGLLKSGYLPFNRVVFVSESESNKEHSSSLGDSVPASNLDGAEISHFYEELVSQPSDASKQKPKDVKMKRKIVKNTCGEISKKVTLNSKSASSSSASLNLKLLHRHAQNGELTELMQYVEQNNPDLNIKDSYGWTPLMCAVCSGHVNVVKYLLQQGADTKTKTSMGLTALDIAEKQGVCSDIRELLLNPFQVRIIKQEPTESLLTNKSNFCHVCKKKYEDLPENHNRSIAHMLNSNSKKDKTYYHIPEHNRGYQIMLKKGWDESKGLGPNHDGRKYPVKTVIKQDRSCIGKSKEKEKITHFGPNDTSAVKSNAEHRSKLVILRERTLKKYERLKLDRKHRRKEIAFRREFYLD